MSSKQHYAQRDICEQKYYTQHVHAMTNEKLHSKSNIAAELAHRDEYISMLEEALTDVTDGESAHDLVGMTGCPLSRCAEIVELSHQITKGK